MKGKAALKKAFEKNSLYFLSGYALIVLAMTIINWSSLRLMQHLVAISTVIVTCHEWEETRFPGGFIELMSRIMGMNVESVDKHAMYAKPDILIFVLTLLGLLVSKYSFFGCAVLVLGCYEGIVHIMGIKLGKLKKPYTPGLVTGEIYAIVSIIGIVLLTREGSVHAGDWILGIIWFFLCFAMMEISVWRVAGISPRDFPKMIKEKISSERQ